MKPPIDPNETFRVLGDLATCHPGLCTACPLHDATRAPRRTMGAGSVDARLMILAEDALDSTTGRPGVLDVILQVSPEKKPRAKFAGLGEVFEDLGLDPMEVYTTSAFKCSRPMYDDVWRAGMISRTEVMPCLTRHLGVELEFIQPAVVAAYGSAGVRFLHYHLPLSKIPTFLKVGEIAVVPTPSSWRFPTLTIVRVPKHNVTFDHPDAIKDGQDLDATKAGFAHAMALARMATPRTLTP